VVASGFWLLALRLAERLLGLARMVVLARLLVPDDFGLFGIALLSMSVLESLSGTGFNEAIIHRQGRSEDYLGTAWTVHIMRGFLLAAALFASAPLVAAFFGEPAAEALLRVLSLNLILSGLTNISVVLFQKDLEFRKLATLGAYGALVDVAVSIVAAFVLRSAWALVYGVLAGNTVRLVLSFVVAPVVRPRFELARFKEMAGFGGWVWGANLLHFLANQGDDVVVGRMLGAPALGLYRMAFAYAGLPATEITHVVSRVTFPAYARLRDDPPALRRGHLRALQATALVSAPLAVGIAVMAPSFVRLVLGPAWLPMIVPLQILAVWGLVRSLSATTGPLFQGLGRPAVITRLVLLKLLTLAALIYPLTAAFGLAGTSLSVALSAAVSYPVGVAAVVRMIGCSLGAYVRTWLFPLVAAVAMGAALVLFHASRAPEFGLAVFFASIVGGALLYAALVVLVGPWCGYHLRAVVGQAAHGKDAAVER
jgi:O-antigen/teichoic acid export membrane protein